MIVILAVISVVALMGSWLVTPSVLGFANRHNIGDYPGERKVHTKFIPRLGGLGIIAGFIAGLGVSIVMYPEVIQAEHFNVLGLFAGLGCIIAVGIYDDIKGIGSTGKLSVQFFAALILVVSGLRVEVITLPFLEPIRLGWGSYLLTIFWLVGITNAFNLLDGLDGLACGVAAIGSLVFFFIGVYCHDPFLMITTASLFFACLGFLRYNFHPASIFMGDTGSLFLGFLMASLGILITHHTVREQAPISMLAIIVALTVPVVDTSVAFFRRIRKRMHPLKADKEHIHHRLMDLGLTHRQTVVIHYAITTSLGIIAFAMILIDPLYVTLLLGIVIVMVFLSIGRLGYLEEMRAKSNSEKPVIQPLSIARIIDRAFLASGDFFAIMLSFLIIYWIRFQTRFSHRV